MWKHAIEEALRVARANIERFGDRFPHVSTDGDRRYQLNDNTEWTDGFWSGILWLGYEYSGDSAFRDAAVRKLPSADGSRRPSRASRYRLPLFPLLEGAVDCRTGRRRQGTNPSRGRHAPAALAGSAANSASMGAGRRFGERRTHHHRLYDEFTLRPRNRGLAPRGHASGPSRRLDLDARTGLGNIWLRPCIPLLAAAKVARYRRSSGEIFCRPAARGQRRLLGLRRKNHSGDEARQLRLRHRGRGNARNPRLLGLHASRSGASRRHGAEDYGRPRKELRHDRRGRRARSTESRFLCSSSRRFAGRLRHLGRLFLPRGTDAPGARRSGVLVRAVSPDRKPSGEFVRTAILMRRVRR